MERTASTSNFIICKHRGPGVRSVSRRVSVRDPRVRLIAEPSFSIGTPVDHPMSSNWALGWSEHDSMMLVGEMPTTHSTLGRTASACGAMCSAPCRIPSNIQESRGPFLRVIEAWKASPDRRLRMVGTPLPAGTKISPPWQDRSHMLFYRNRTCTT